jgi:4,5-dihydroxyphthalate decarboxylase
MTSATRLRTAIGSYGYTTALFNGAVQSDSVALDIEPLTGTLRVAMTRMVRDLAFDLCEISPTSYLMARVAGAPITAIPVFPFRQFSFNQLVVRDDSGIESPQDIQGMRIGLRTWAQPTALWLRYILASHYGCHLDSVSWTFVAEDPFPGIRRPERSTDRGGESLSELLTNGSVDAIMGTSELPDGCHFLFKDPISEAREWYSKTGIIPADHVLVVRTDVGEPALWLEIAQLFEKSKREFLASGEPDSVIQHLREVTAVEDPLPNGWSANREMWELLVQATYKQGMLEREPRADEFIEQFELKEA